MDLISNDLNHHRSINITDKDNMEIVSFAYNMVEGGSYVEKIFYELETSLAVMFGRNIDDRVLFIPKSAIKGGWIKDNIKAQNIKIKFGIKLYWRPRKP